MRCDLVTRRLRLRPFNERDQPAMADLFADADVRRYLALGDMGQRGAENFAHELIAGSADEWREGGCGLLAVTGPGHDFAADLAIGYCGLRLLPDRISAVELLYALGRRHWGQGLATEAGRAVLEWGFANLEIREILALCRPEHGASRRVMEKLGMRHGGETDRYYGETLALYRIAREARPNV